MYGLYFAHLFQSIKASSAAAVTAEPLFCRYTSSMARLLAKQPIFRLFDADEADGDGDYGERLPFPCFRQIQGFLQRRRGVADGQNGFVNFFRRHPHSGGGASDSLFAGDIFGLRRADKTMGGRETARSNSV